MSNIKRDPHKLLEEIEAFLVRVDMNPSDFGTLAKNDSGLVFRLRQGKDVRSGTASELRRFMAEYPPSNPKRRAEARSSAHA